MTQTSPSSQTLLPRPRRRWKSLALALLVLVTGVAIGAGGATMFILHQVRYAIHHPDEIPTRLTARLSRRLSLTPDQGDRVHELIARRMDHINTLRRDFQPKLESELTGLHSDVRVLLTAEQQAKWDSLFDDLTKNWLPEASGESTSTRSTDPATMP